MRWNEISKRIPQDRPTIGVEVGVWQGENAAKLLELNPKLFLYMVDQWIAGDESYIASGDGKSKLSFGEMIEAKAVAIMSTNGYESRSLILEMSSIEAAEMHWASNLPDFVFIDANHSYDSVKQDIELWWPLIKKGGFISGHDYGVYPGVKKAVDERFGTVELGEDFTWFKSKDDD